MILRLHKCIVEKWITLRLAAQEFYFKQPFEIKDEYPIMKIILFFALVPMELIFIFLYARIFGSLSAYNLEIILTLAIINMIVSNLLINYVKEKPFIRETVVHYRQLDYYARKKLYSLKNGTIAIFLTTVMPWLLSFICISIICYLIPN